jgi:hypothetical protein
MGHRRGCEGREISVNSQNQIFQSQLSDFFQLIFINKHPLVALRLMMKFAVRGAAMEKFRTCKFE